MGSRCSRWDSNSGAVMVHLADAHGKHSRAFGRGAFAETQEGNMLRYKGEVPPRDRG